MFCSNCGKPIPEESKFCPYCGQANLFSSKVSPESASVSASSVSTPEIPVYQTSIPDPSVTPVKRKKTWLIVIAAVVGAAILLFLLLRLIGGGSSGESGAAKEESQTPLTDQINDTIVYETPEPYVDPRFSMNDDGTVDTFTDDDGTVWQYYYDDNGNFTNRVGTIAYPDWEWGEYKQYGGSSSTFSASPAELSQVYENCIGFDVSYEVVSVTYGKPYGKYVVYVEEPPAVTFVDEGFVEVKEGETTYESIFFDSPKTVKAIALRPYGLGNISYSSSMGIYNLRILSFDYIAP